MENRPKKKLLVLVREAIWRKHYSKRTGIGSGLHYCKQIKYTEPLVIFYKNTNDKRGGPADEYANMQA